MLKNYSEILSIPGAWQFSVAGLIARFPMSIVGISQILMITALYDSYTLAGQVSASSIIAYAIFAPFLAKLVDRYGQAKVMGPALTICVSSLGALIFSALMHANPLWLYLFTSLAGASSGSLGALVRSRWTQVVQTPAQMHTAYAMESTIDEFVFVVGPVLATVLTTGVSPIAGLALAISFIVIGGSWFLSQKATEPPVSADHVEGPQPQVIMQPVIIALGAVYMCAGALFGSIDVSVVAFAEELGNVSTSGVLLGIFAGGSMVAGLLYGSRSWRFPLWKLFVGGVLALAVGATLITLATSNLTMGLIMFITGFSISPTMINVNTMVQRTVSERQLTEGLTWMSTFMNIGVSLGAALAGRFVDAVGATGGFNVTVVAAWTMVAITLLAIPVLRKASLATDVV
ncbi:transporter, major facilitator family protein [Gleimia coleocanis DSM 15436]|uniref:Transporter, major facilitator family protein n=1 Tax=Gleimia coleocanis DSM 15436 TaxID=525245 RepID=C0VY53_9ACTO|nr:MFS transporter [Gleimia coleocanis]EEH64356.1 transporter, major facilitator family protein [Gleimia coleocanis DSM 15436]